MPQFGWFIRFFVIQAVANGMSYRLTRWPAARNVAVISAVCAMVVIGAAPAGAR
ncbi:MAG TPA: hypothetical protein VGP63_30400 [Planctomycetaceae bacterium]|jgi:hypothetical protein|nr:hypothetical protein [Planctomycetaceae bacterium]